MWDEKRRVLKMTSLKQVQKWLSWSMEKKYMAIPYPMMPSDLIDYLVIFVDFTLPIKSLLLSVLTSYTMNLETF